jgi:hypothetical protein
MDSRPSQTDRHVNTTTPLLERHSGFSDDRYLAGRQSAQLLHELLPLEHHLYSAMSSGILNSNHWKFSESFLGFIHY